MLNVLLLATVGVSTVWWRGGMEGWMLNTIGDRFRVLADTISSELNEESPEVRDLFAQQGVLTPLELESRFEVYAEQYVLAIDVEAKLAVQIAQTQIYPAAMRYLGELASSLQLQTSMGLQVSPDTQHKVASLCAKLIELSNALESAISQAPHGTIAHMRYSSDTLMPLMHQLREAVDGLEALGHERRWCRFPDGPDDIRFANVSTLTDDFGQAAHEALLGHAPKRHRCGLQALVKDRSRILGPIEFSH